jgi:hypothetical protein
LRIFASVGEKLVYRKPNALKVSFQGRASFWDTGESLLIKSKKVCAAFGDAFEIDYSGSPS